MIDLKINLGQILVSAAAGLLGLMIRWGVNSVKHDRERFLSALRRFDYVDTIASATYKVVAEKYPAETGAAVQQALRTKADAQQRPNGNGIGASA